MRVSGITGNRGREQALGEECVSGRQSKLVSDGQEGRQRREPAEAIQVSHEGKSSDGR